MLVDPSNPAAGSRVNGGIRQASQATGASFNYLLATAQVESGLDPQAGVTVADGKPFVKAAFLALLWQIFRGSGFPNQFFCDSWAVGLWRGRPWRAGHRIGRKSLDVGSNRFWIGWGTRRGDKCARSMCRG